VTENYRPTTGGAGPLRILVPPAYAGLRLDQALSRLLPQYSRTRLALWVRAKKINLDGAAAIPRRRVWGGEVIDILEIPDAHALPDQPEDIKLNIVYEDAALLVVNKPPGLVVHPGSGNRSGTLLNALLAHIPGLAALPRAGIVHRLDKDTSGLLVVAKTLPAQTDLVRQLQARTIAREYLALVHGRVSSGGTVDAPLGRHPTQRTRMAVIARGRNAVTHYEVVKRYSDTTLLRCRLETGRTHQIRVHMNSIRHPLVGDPVYGRRRPTIPFPRQALHAERLAVRHPETGRVMRWRAPVPSDMRSLLMIVGKRP